MKLNEVPNLEQKPPFQTNLQDASGFLEALPDTIRTFLSSSSFAISRCSGPWNLPFANHLMSKEEYQTWVEDAKLIQVEQLAGALVAKATETTYKSLLLSQSTQDDLSLKDQQTEKFRSLIKPWKNIEKIDLKSSRKILTKKEHLWEKIFSKGILIQNFTIADKLKTPFKNIVSDAMREKLSEHIEISSPSNKNEVNIIKYYWTRIVLIQGQAPKIMIDLEHVADVLATWIFNKRLSSTCTKPENKRKLDSLTFLFLLLSFCPDFLSNLTNEHNAPSFQLIWKEIKAIRKLLTDERREKASPGELDFVKDEGIEKRTQYMFRKMVLAIPEKDLEPLKDFKMDHTSILSLQDLIDKKIDEKINITSKTLWTVCQNLKKDMLYDLESQNSKIEQMQLNVAELTQTVDVAKAHSTLITESINFIDSKINRLTTSMNNSSTKASLEVNDKIKELSRDLNSKMDLLESSVQQVMNDKKTCDVEFNQSLTELQGFCLQSNLELKQSYRQLQAQHLELTEQMKEETQAIKLATIATNNANEVSIDLLTRSTSELTKQVELVRAKDPEPPPNNNSTIWFFMSHKERWKIKGHHALDLQCTFSGKLIHRLGLRICRTEDENCFNVRDILFNLEKEQKQISNNLNREYFIDAVDRFLHKNTLGSRPPQNDRIPVKESTLNFPEIADPSPPTSGFQTPMPEPASTKNSPPKTKHDNAYSEKEFPLPPPDPDQPPDTTLTEPETRSLQARDPSLKFLAMCKNPGFIKTLFGKKPD